MAPNSAHVIVVDDEPNLCVVIQRILEKGGYRVTTTTEGQTALKLVQDIKPDVVLLDLMMPGLNGQEVSRRIRESGADTRIIYFTAKADASDPSMLKKLHEGADGILIKPATSKQILSKVESVLKNVRL